MIDASICVILAIDIFHFHCQLFPDYRCYPHNTNYSEVFAILSEYRYVEHVVDLLPGTIVNWNYIPHTC